MLRYVFLRLLYIQYELIQYYTFFYPNVTYFSLFFSMFEWNGFIVAKLESQKKRKNESRDPIIERLLHYGYINLSYCIYNISMQHNCAQTDSFWHQSFLKTLPFDHLNWTLTKHGLKKTWILHYAVWNNMSIILRELFWST